MKARPVVRSSTMRLSAFVLATIMVAPTLLGGVSATHQDPETFDLPELAPLRVDESTCFPTAIQRMPEGLAASLAESQSAESPGPFWDFVERDGRNVPVLCFGPSGGESTDEYRQSVESLNSALHAVADVMHAIENFTAYHAESYAPYSLTTMLYDGFEDHEGDQPRRGGYGEWRRIVLDGPADAWHEVEEEDAFRNPRQGWRFSDPEGPYYPDFTDTALVSPIIDLAGVDVGPGAANGEYLCQLENYLNQCIHAVTGPRDLWETLQEQFEDSPLNADAGNAGNPFTAADAVMESAFQMHERQGAVVLEVTHRFNLASQQDGVRFEVWDHYPTADELQRLIEEGTIEDNPANGVKGVKIIEPVEPPTRDPEAQAEDGSFEFSNGDLRPRQGGFPTKRGETSPASEAAWQPTAWFRQNDACREAERRAEPEPASCRAFTGNVNVTTTAAFDLSEFAGKQVHLVVRAKTGLIVDKANYFKDEELFRRDVDYGYFLDAVNVTAQVKPHNVRVFDEPAAPAMKLPDDPSAWTVRPPRPGEEDRSINFYVTNFGRYVENVTARFTIECVASCEGTVPSPDPIVQGPRVMEPGEVWQAGFEPPEGVFAKLDSQWKVTVAAVGLDDRSGGQPSGAPVAVENTTADNPTRSPRFNFSEEWTHADPWQPRDETYYGVAGDNEQSITFRVREERRLEAVAPPKETLSVKIVPGVSDKDKPRTLTATFRNTGNTVEDVQVDVTVHADDRSRTFEDFFITPPKVHAGWMAPGDELTLEWDLRPYVTGAFPVEIAFTNATNGKPLGSAPVQVLYSGRTSGVVCGDDLYLSRACTAGWALERPQELQLASPRAAWRAANGDVWAVGDDSFLFVFTDVDQNGEREWIDMANASTAPAVGTPFPADANLTAVDGHAVAGGNYVVYVAGERGHAWRFDGAWTRLAILDPDTGAPAPEDSARATAQLNAVLAANATRVWFAGDDGTLLTLDAEDPDRLVDAAFSPNVPASFVKADIDFNAMTAASPERAWVVGTQGVILAFNGAAWNLMRAPDGAHESLHTVRAFTNGAVLAGGDFGVVLSRSGTATTESWVELRSRDLAEPTIRGFARTPKPEAFTWAVGDDGTLLRCDSCDAPSLNARAYAKLEDGRGFAVSADGVALPCQDCVDPGNFTRITAPVPFIDRTNLEPLLTNGTHAFDGKDQWKSGALTGKVTFRVQYTDPEGAAPHYVHAVLDNGTRIPLTLARGSPDDGGLYTGTYRMAADVPRVIGYHFETSDGIHSARTLASDTAAVVRVGGDLWTGGDAPGTAASALAANATVFPPFSGLKGTAPAGDTDWFSFQVKPGETFNVTLGGDATGDFEARVHAVVVDEDGTPTVGDEVARLENDKTDDRHFAVVDAPEGADARWLLRVTPSSTPMYNYTIGIVAVTPTDVNNTRTFPVGVDEHSSVPRIPQSLRFAADVLTVVDDGGFDDAIALLEDGYLLRFFPGNVYENLGDWDPDYHLRSLNPNGTSWWGSNVRKGQQDNSAAAGGLIVRADSNGAPAQVQSAVLTVRHNLWSLDADDRDPRPVEIRLAFHEHVGTGSQLAQTNPTQLLGCYPTNRSIIEDSSTDGDPECTVFQHRVIERYFQPHAWSDWVTESFDVTEIMNANPHLNPQNGFAGVLFVLPRNEDARTSNATHWAVDEVKLVLNGDDANPLLHWAGEDKAGVAASMKLAAAEGSPTLSGLDAWATTKRPVFGFRGIPSLTETERPDYDDKNLWHRSELADSPIWVANDADGNDLRAPDHAGTMAEISGLTSWLVTPIVDLRQTESPVLEFKHGFSGRLTDMSGCLDVADVGRVMVQVFDPKGPNGGAWSRWVPVDPEGGYPARGYNGAPDADVCSGSSLTIDEYFEYGHGFYHRTKPLDDLKSSGNLLRIENHETVRVPLSGANVRDVALGDDDAHLSVGAAKSFARFAFVFNTSRHGDGTNVAGTAGSVTHAGWYVSDVRVLGESKLGQDLEVQDFRPVVGYDWETIGFGPSTGTEAVTVPFTLNVTNDGSFNVPGFSVVLEATEVVDANLQITRTTQVDAVRYDQVVVPGETRQVNLSWRVPAGKEGTNWTVRATALPLGIVDENPADNLMEVGSVSSAVPVQRREGITVRVDALPRAESADLARFLPVYLVNTGNVPLKDFTVTRRIFENRGTLGMRLVDERSWTTERSVAEGSVSPITILNQSVDVLRDLYWTPPRQATYLVEGILQQAGSDLVIRNRVAVDAFSTYLFDDAAGTAIGETTRGTAQRGSWQLTGDGWTHVETGGFEDSGAYHFGDPLLGTYPDGANASLVTPTVDLTSASTARLTFWQKFDFEHAYDAGVVEASLDGGETWTILTPDGDERFDLPAGYVDTVLNAASPLDEDDDPWTAVKGFTGSSSDLEGNLDGFVQSRFDLGQLEELVETTTYVNFTVDAQTTRLLRRCVFERDFEREACEDRPYYADDSWLAGDVRQDEYWSFENAYDNALKPTNAEHGFLWSGSFNVTDDGETLPRPTVLNVTVDLTSVDPASTEKVILTYRDWMRRDGLAFQEMASKGLNPMGGTLKLESTGTIRTYRTNWTDDMTYFVTGQDGLWWDWRVDLSEHRGETVDLRFIYAPHKPPTQWGRDTGTVTSADETSLTDDTKSWGGTQRWLGATVTITGGTGEGQVRTVGTGNMPTTKLTVTEPWSVQPDASSTYRVEHTAVQTPQAAAVSDPGWIIDDFQVFTERDTRGRKEVVDRLYDMADMPVIAKGGHCRSEAEEVPCLNADNNGENKANQEGPIFDPERDFVPVTDASARGTGWFLYRGADESERVTKPVRDTQWTTLGLETDIEFIQQFRDHRGGKFLPTGEESRVFWSGTKTVPVDEPKNVGRNIAPGTDSRLVTPAIDLGKVAGKDALLEFWHFHGFLKKDLPNDPELRPQPEAIGDLGIVELQVWNPVTESWGPWQQMYRGDAPLDDPKTRGGYPGGFALDYENENNMLYYVGTDLDTHFNETLGQRYVYGFMGKSLERDTATENGWVRETFDLSDYVGERVRVGFRQITLVTSPTERSVIDGHDHCVASDAGVVPTSCFENKGPGQAGWFIDEVRVIGDTLAGKPVTLRFRAGSDDGLSKGGWTIDDVTVAGASYGRNVGVFLDEAPTGGAPGRSAWVNGTLRNLADTVRRDLAVEILDATLDDKGRAPAVPIEFEAVAVDGGVPFKGDNGLDPRALLTGIDLPARGAMDFAFRLTVPEGADEGNRRLIVRVVEFNEAATTDPEEPVFTRITDNEVEGFLNRDLAVTVSRDLATHVGRPVVTPALADVNESVTITVPLENDGFIPVTFDASCTARHVRAWETINHRQLTDNVPRFGPARACEAIVDSVTLGAERSGELAFRFTPDEPGYWQFSFDADATDDQDQSQVQELPTVPLMVGRDPFFFQEDFEGEFDRSRWRMEVPYQEDNWMGTDDVAFHADQARAASGNWSLRAGLSDAEFNADTSRSYQQLTNYTIISPWIDLHNASAGDPLFLRFKHLPRMAYGDGADVDVEILTNEEFPQGGASRIVCKIHPTGGYDGPVLSYFSPDGFTNPAGHQNDTNPAFAPYGDWEPARYSGPEGVFASDASDLEGRLTPDVREWITGHMGAGPEKRFFTGFEEQWRTAEFNLADVKCPLKNADDPVNVLGYTVRFHFNMYTGKNDAPIGDVKCGNDRWDRDCDDVAPNDAGLIRGRGQGWFIDDVAISGYNLNFSAPETTFLVKDNATKLYPALVRNDALFQDRVRVFVDENASNVPDGTASAFVDDVVLQPMTGDNESVAWTRVDLPRDPGLLPIQYKVRVVAQSELDPTIERERIIPLDFFPDKYADLKVTVDDPEGRVQEGSTAILPITVENLGLVASPAPAIVLVEEHGSETRTCVVSAGASGDRVKSDEGCPSAASGRSANRDIASFFKDPASSRAVYAYAWNPLPGKGDHRVTIIVDPLDDIEEYLKTDNRQTLDIAVTELLQPDLALSADGLVLRADGRSLVPDTSNGDVIRYEVEEGDHVVFELSLLNKGPVGATNPDVRGFIGPLSLALNADERPRFIPAGSEQVVAFPPWQAQKGEWVLQFNARTDLVELDDANNRLPNAGLIILTVKGFEVGAHLDLPDRVLEPGETVRANLTLSNDGSTAEEVDLHAGLPDGWTARFDENPVFLRKGETGALSRTVPVTVTTSDRATAGEHLITIQAVARENSMKAAVATGKLTIRAFHALDVEPVRHTSPPGVVSVPVRVTNTGNAPGPYAVTAALPAGWTLADDAPAFSVTPFTTETKALGVVTPPGTPVGEYAFDVTLAVPGGKDVTAPVTVAIEPWRAIAFRTLSEEPVAADALAFDVEATNVGNVEAPFTVLAPDLAEGWRVDVEPPGAMLAPGESRTFRVIASPPTDVTLGEWTFPLYAHFEGVQPGSPEGRANRGDLTVRLVQPDLALTEFTFSPRVEIEPLTRVSVRAPVTNDGNAVAESVTVALFVDDVLIEAVTVARLAPGETTDVLFNWTAVGGKHAMTVVLDPFEDVLEIARDNNAATRVVVVNGEQQTVRGTPAATTDTPGFGIVTLALAVLGAALVARGPRRSKD